jgi:hypothetical protein
MQIPADFAQSRAVVDLVVDVGIVQEAFGIVVDGEGLFGEAEAATPALKSGDGAEGFG